jgi:hypothetical protein
MADLVRFGEREVGPGQPVYVIAEIGINHNGDVGLARQLIDAAVRAGSDAVKFQKRTPEICVPPDQRHLVRDTPWGVMSYLDYRRRLEFSADEFAAIVEHCAARQIDWLASSWDLDSVAFVEQFEPLMKYKSCGALPFVAVRVKATGTTEKPRLPFVRPRRASKPVPVAARSGRFGGRSVKVSFYRWDALEPGARAIGPAVVTGGEATIVVPPRFRFHVDGFRNVICAR